MTPQQKHAAVREMNIARLAYKALREHLGQLNRTVARLNHSDHTAGGILTLIVKERKARTFGDMNRARARLRRAIRAVESFIIRRPRATEVSMPRVVQQGSACHNGTHQPPFSVS